MSEIMQEMGKLSSAEEFLIFFGVEFDQQVVNVHRLHILKRFHQYLAQSVAAGGDASLRAEYKALLARAYEDFVHSDARTEKVFKVFRDSAGIRTICAPRSRTGTDHKEDIYGKARKTCFCLHADAAAGTSARFVRREFQRFGVDGVSAAI
jgi:nitrogenase-stabilizing/protective protein